MSDNLFIGDDTRDRLMDGVCKIASVVGKTMGTSGGNVLLEAMENPGHASTNDGATIIEAIRLSDPLEEMGRRIILEAVSRANRSSGDGSSTTTVLVSAILEEGIKHLGEASPMELKRSLEACIPIIEKSIKDQTKEITVDEVSQVAAISAEDEGIGAIIQEIYKKIGKDGVINWDVSKTGKDFYTLGKGLTVNATVIASPYLGDVGPDGRFLNGIKWNNPKIILCKQKIDSAQDFNDIFSQLFAEGKKEVVIFCDDIDFPVLAQFVEMRVQREFKAFVVKLPVVWRDEWWEDLALASGGTLVGTTQPIKIKDLKPEHLGTFEHLTVDKENTYIDGIKDLSARVKELQDEGSDASLQRAQRLNTQTARYFIGATSDNALFYKRLKIEDAINSAHCALHHGIVPGGGVALLTACTHLGDMGVGGIILSEALKKPFRQILENCGENPDHHKDYGDPLTVAINGMENKNLGFDSRTGKTVNMFDAGIVDASDVILNAVKCAIGVAATILTINSVVLLPKQEPLNLPR